MSIGVTLLGLARVRGSSLNLAGFDVGLDSAELGFA